MVANLSGNNLPRGDYKHVGNCKYITQLLYLPFPIARLSFPIHSPLISRHLFNHSPASRPDIQRQKRKSSRNNELLFASECLRGFADRHRSSPCIEAENGSLPMRRCNLVPLGYGRCMPPQNPQVVKDCKLSNPPSDLGSKSLQTLPSSECRSRQ